MEINQPSEAQLNYIKALQRRLHLPDRMLSDHCVTRFGKTFDRLNRTQTSLLLDEMISWEQLPADMQRAKGQQDLPGMTF